MTGVALPPSSAMETPSLRLPRTIRGSQTKGANPDETHQVTTKRTREEGIEGPDLLPYAADELNKRREKGVEM